MKTKLADQTGAAPYDQILLITSLLMTSIGLYVIFAASNVMAQAHYQDPYYFIKRQLMYGVLGLVALFIGYSINYHSYRKYVYHILILSGVTLVLVFFPFIGAKIRGSARWLRLGPFTVQPSEFAKIAMVLFLAFSFTKKDEERMKIFSIGFLPHILVGGVFILLIAAETDFGSAMTLGAIIFVMLFVGGSKLSQLILTGLAGGSLAAFAIIRYPEKFARIKSFLDPWKYGADVGYQLKQSLLAIGSGQVWGMGAGQSRAKLFFLPDAHTDFILSILTEEFGFLGIMAVLILFGLLVYRGLRLSLKAPDSFGSFLALGLTLVLALPAVINMGVVSGLLPTKGLSMPFFSYGGSGLMSSMLAVGILLNISSQVRQPVGLTAPKTAAPAAPAQA
jgi:cell division protein FtsW